MTNGKQKYILLENLNGQKTEKVPFWFMRQAGRYLPEYRELRKTAGGFLDLAYDPEKASEVTLQPIRRFGMHGAILFSDILVIPQALGQKLEFVAGEGPKLDALQGDADIEKLDIEKIDDVLNPVYETVLLTRQKLADENFDGTCLLGFAGAPWTVACYMIEGGGSKTFAKTLAWSKNNPESFQKLIDILCRSTVHYLSRQIDAGAQAVQIFDSWAGILDETGFEKWVMEPTKRIVADLRKIHSDTPVIGFPREAGEKSVNYAKNTGINAIGMDYSLDREWARDNLQEIMPVQGNLHPETLLKGGGTLEKEAFEILDTFSGKPFVFNLGHGVIKETPVSNVEQLCNIIRNYRN